ncbi:hypothetical protein CYLTODRAFT_419168, partial [Cylindrobasidium torrendii FP15055 ss-10]
MDVDEEDEQETKRTKPLTTEIIRRTGITMFALLHHRRRRVAVSRQDQVEMNKGTGAKGDWD